MLAYQHGDEYVYKRTLRKVRTLCPHKVDIVFKNVVHRRDEQIEVLKWVREKFGPPVYDRMGLFTEDATWDAIDINDRLPKAKIRFYFRDASAAMMFKLKWGGEIIK